MLKMISIDHRKPGIVQRRKKEIDVDARDVGQAFYYADGIRGVQG